MGIHTGAKEYSRCTEQDALLAPVCDHSVASSTGFGCCRQASGKAAVGLPTKRKRKRMDEKKPLDEGPVVTSPTRLRAETDVARAPEEANTSERTEQQSRELGAMLHKQDMPLEDRQQANEANFLERVREAAYADEDLQQRWLKKKLTKEQGLWWKEVNGEHMALYIPPDAANMLRQECLKWIHVHPFSGHVDRDMTSELLRREFWWPGMQEDVSKYVEDYEMCSRNKPTNRKKAGLLSPLPIPGRPWESIGMDFITHLPKTKAGYTAIYVVIDRLTKLVHIAATTDTATAADTATLFLDMVFKHHGLPRSIIRKVYKQLLDIILCASRHTVEDVNSTPSRDRWADRKNEQGHCGYDEALY